MAQERLCNSGIPGSVEGKAELDGLAACPRSLSKVVAEL